MRVLDRLSMASLLLLAMLAAPTMAGAVDAGTQGAQPVASTPPDLFTQWTSAVSRRLIYGVKPPPNGPKASGRVVVRFTVDRAGHVIRQDIAETSGFETYDKAALQALAKAQPFPPIPASVDRDQVVMTQAFRFKYAPPAQRPAKKPS